ncbi:MAG: type II toxin-antitoxin system HigB family toxin [Prevotellaceae bacterium]|jgi:mRNA interferase HigB|nr:type II toxin-antitoxin system HigB family toxin [Prevotellaceae bacterium]
MIVFNIEILDECVLKHASIKKVISKFVEIFDNATIENHNELLKFFPKADYLGNNRYVFDIKGNNFRVVCVVVFMAGSVFVRFAGTHAEYDKIDAKTV